VPLTVDNDTVTAYVGLGSNLGDRAGNLLLAVRGLTEASFTVHKLSAVYETEPVGVEGHGSYLNMAAEIRVRGVTPSQMMARMLRIEYLLGRRDKSALTPRTADLDLLLFGDEVIDTELLTVPHPRLHLRRFVLVPMAEIAPHLVHPAIGKGMSELLRETPDRSDVVRWEPNGAAESGQATACDVADRNG
jgi:2-amino-4-hydroxy-6-hydroxymethyldihydropteridine diphosphokinase